MGWTFPRSIRTREALAQQLVRSEYRMRSGQRMVLTTLDVHRKGSVLYRLISMTAVGCPEQEIERFVKVYELAKDDGSWGYKDIHECMQPYHYDAPVTWLSGLSKPFGANSLAWRQEVARRAGQTYTHDEGRRCEQTALSLEVVG